MDDIFKNVKVCLLPNNILVHFSSKASEELSHNDLLRVIKFLLCFHLAVRIAHALTIGYKGPHPQAVPSGIEFILCTTISLAQVSN